MEKKTHKIIDNHDIDCHNCIGIFSGTFTECEEYLEKNNITGYEIVPLSLSEIENQE